MQKLISFRTLKKICYERSIDYYNKVLICLKTKKKCSSKFCPIWKCLRRVEVSMKDFAEYLKYKKRVEKKHSKSKVTFP